ncbi:MAG: calcium-translocating P-type ATPase, PMCA-type [Lachnospiraceae bacterium]|nr:calcium-translocating P-type ATPase, PMCA-type [Lachnospiraceae bacterium]
MYWHNMSFEETIKELDSDISFGLSNRQAEEKREQYGSNEITEKKRVSPITRFFMQFNDFMIFILLIAAGVSMGISLLNGERDFIDPIIILMIVILNAFLGLFQELKAEKSLEALKKLSAPEATVIRGGKLVKLSTKLLVPGDIIIVHSGDMVPADARLIESINLKAEEAALTGESAPVDKDASLKVKAGSLVGDRKNMIFAGSSITYGRGKAIATATGMYTEMGKIADLISKDEAPDTPLQLKLAETSKILGMGALIICLIIFIIGLLRSFPPFFMFMTSVSLAVAAIPEGLPAIVTIMLAIGVQRMAGRRAIIRRLPAVETLGSANVICSDKTGTLTQNKMRVVEISGLNGELDKKSREYGNILQYGALCNDSVLEVRGEERNVFGDPTESALVLAAYEDMIAKNDLDDKFPRVGEVPFDSSRKLMTTIHKTDEGYLCITKGAPDILINKCRAYCSRGAEIPLGPSDSQRAKRLNSEMAGRALRVIGISYKIVKELPKNIKAETIENDLVFMGFFGIIDPPRPEVLHAVRVCKKAGIKPVMVTGDHVITAKAIAEKIGIMKAGDKAITGEELNKISQEELNEIIDDYAVFARVTPEHKVKIVKAFQSQGNVVAMTGDGVNDAPALKAADIGCAMGITGTDVAKGAADMVLMDDNFATIVEAVREGRGIYENIRKAIHFLLSSNIGEILTIFVSILLGWDMPLLAIHLLWVNLITDSLPAVALGLDPAEDTAMERKPYSNHRSFFSDGLWKRIAIEGVMIGLLALIAFGTGVVYFDPEGSCLIGRTMCFATLSISQLVHAFNMRSEKSIFEVGIKGNLYLIGAFFIGVILEAAVIMIPSVSRIFRVSALDFKQWLIVALLCFMPIFIVEMEKFLTKPRTFTANTKSLLK